MSVLQLRREVRKLCGDPEDLSIPATTQVDSGATTTDVEFSELLARLEH